MSWAKAIYKVKGRFMYIRLVRPDDYVEPVEPILTLPKPTPAQEAGNE